jgi:hypothetical protein
MPHSIPVRLLSRSKSQAKLSRATAHRACQFRVLHKQLFCLGKRERPRLPTDELREVMSKKLTGAAAGNTEAIRIYERMEESGSVTCRPGRRLAGAEGMLFPFGALLRGGLLAKSLAQGETCGGPRVLR